MPTHTLHHLVYSLRLAVALTQMQIPPMASRGDKASEFLGAPER